MTHTKKYYDKKIKEYKEDLVKFGKKIQKHLDMFSPLSDEREEERLLSILRRIRKIKGDW